MLKIQSLTKAYQFDPVVSSLLEDCRMQYEDDDLEELIEVASQAVIKGRAKLRKAQHSDRELLGIVLRVLVRR